MGKKKQAVISFPSTNDRVVVEQIVPNAAAGSGLLADTLVLLCQATRLQDQIKVVQQCKGVTKTYLLANPEQDDAAKAVEQLLLLYLSPLSFPLRSSLEWLIDILASMHRKVSGEGKNLLVGTVRKVCLNVWDECQQPVNRDIESLLSYCLSFSAMSQIEKDIPWLKEDEDTTKLLVVQPMAIVNLEKEHRLRSFIAFLEGIYSACAEKIGNCANNIVDGGEAAAGGPSTEISASEVIRYAECCGEAIKSIVTVLKGTGAYILPARTSPAESSSGGWADIVHRLLCSCITVLSSEHLVSKDVLSSTALGIVSMQHLSRLCHGNQIASRIMVLDNGSLPTEVVSSRWLDSSLAARQGIALVHILRLTSSSTPQTASSGMESDTRSRAENIHQKRVESLEVIAREAGLHPLLIRGLLHLPSQHMGGIGDMRGIGEKEDISILSKCALLRAAISVICEQPSPMTPPPPPPHASQRIACSQDEDAASHSHQEAVSAPVSAPVHQDASYQKQHRSSLLLPPPSPSFLLSDILFHGIMAVCAAPLPVDRLLGLQTMEGWLGRLEALLSVLPVASSSSPPSASSTPSILSIPSTLSPILECIANKDVVTHRLLSLADLLISAWSHPARQVSHIVPVVFMKVVGCLACLHPISLIPVPFLEASSGGEPWMDRTCLILP